MKTIKNSIEIFRMPSEVMDYVTRPANWYEWYPSSKKTSIESKSMKLGDKFSIITIQKPFKGLFPAIEKSINWTVTEYIKDSNWRITSSSNSIELDTQYELIQTDNGTLFIRNFNYKPKGILRIVEPIALRKGLVSQADIALRNLKTVLERQTSKNKNSCSINTSVKAYQHHN